MAREFSRIVPVFLGPAIVVGAMSWAHGVGLAFHLDDYVAAPPTISRALLFPNVAGPFAGAMIVSAILLTVAVIQLTFGLHTCVNAVGVKIYRHMMLLLAALACELSAIAGMIVLSQFTGNISTQLHTIGSYMLFFGHAIGIALLGLLIRSMLGASNKGGSISETGYQELATLHRHPRRAAGVAVLSVLFGLVYFGGQQLSDAYFFWQRMVLSVLEVLAILAFLGFLISFAPFLKSPGLFARAAVRQTVSGGDNQNPISLPDIAATQLLK